MGHCKISLLLPPPSTRLALSEGPRMKLYAVLAFSAALALAAGTAGANTAAAAAIKPDPAKGQALAAACQACHTADGGRGVPTYPILQGQHSEYLVKQLSEFKAGKRANPIMAGMAAPLGQEDMLHIAAYFASKKAQDGAARNKDTVALGERIYRGGIAAKQVPACAGCHSPNGAGIPAQYPRLAGQHAEYTEAQLTAFRAGARGNSAQMTGIAARLSDAEIKAVSDYMSGLR